MASGRRGHVYPIGSRLASRDVDQVRTKRHRGPASTLVTAVWADSLRSRWPPCVSHALPNPAVLDQGDGTTRRRARTRPRRACGLAAGPAATRGHRVLCRYLKGLLSRTELHACAVLYSTTSHPSRTAWLSASTPCSFSFLCPSGPHHSALLIPLLIGCQATSAYSHAAMTSIFAARLPREQCCRTKPVLDRCATCEPGWLAAGLHRGCST